MSNTPKVLNADRTLIKSLGLTTEVPTRLNGCATSVLNLSYLVIETKGKDQLILGGSFISMYRVMLNLPECWAEIGHQPGEVWETNDELCVTTDDGCEYIDEDVAANTTVDKQVPSDLLRVPPHEVMVLQVDAPISNTMHIISEINPEGHKIPPLDHLNWMGPDEKEKLQRILWNHKEAFQKSKEDLGRTTLIKHEIELVEGAVPHKEPSRRMSPEKTRQANEQVDELLSKGWIVHSKSPWGAGIVMVSKKDTNELRMCVDYRMLNEYTVKDAYALPRIDDSITNLGDAKYMSKFEFGRVFHQVPIRECDQYKTAFSTPRGLFHWTHMPFGLCNATATYQRLMDMVLSGIKQEYGNVVICYVDDILIAIRTLEQP